MTSETASRDRRDRWSSRYVTRRRGHFCCLCHDLRLCYAIGERESASVARRNGSDRTFGSSGHPGQCAIRANRQPGTITASSLCFLCYPNNRLAYILALKGGRLVSSGEAGLISMLDVVLGPLWVWLFGGFNWSSHHPEEDVGIAGRRRSDRALRAKL